MPVQSETSYCVQIIHYWKMYLKLWLQMNEVSKYGPHFPKYLMKDNTDFRTLQQLCQVRCSHELASTSLTRLPHFKKKSLVSSDSGFKMSLISLFCWFIECFRGRGSGSSNISTWHSRTSEFRIAEDPFFTSRQTKNDFFF